MITPVDVHNVNHHPYIRLATELTYLPERITHPLVVCLSCLRFCLEAGLDDIWARASISALMIVSQ